MTSARELRVASDSLGTLVGRALSSVEFVQDYVQLRFDGPTLTVLTSISVLVDGVRLRETDPGFRDALCHEIGKTVAGTSIVPGGWLDLVFVDRSVVRVSLAPDDYVGPEGVLFGEGGRLLWVL